MRDDFVELDSGRYAVVDFGGGGPDVLLLHDLLSTAEIWRPFAEVLPQFCHAVAVDLCGHGQTSVTPESVETLVADLPLLVDALGLTRPLVVVGQEEHIPLFADGLRQIGAPGVLVAFAFNCFRGAEARRQRDESLGLEALDGWVTRSRLFVDGPPGTVEEFVEERVAAASADWVNQGVEFDQLRRYFERQIRTTPHGWERVPRRKFIEDALHHVDAGPLGLDALDALEVPVWALVAVDVENSDELARFEDWADERPGRRIVPIADVIAIDGLDPQAFGQTVHELLQQVETAPTPTPPSTPSPTTPSAAA